MGQNLDDPISMDGRSLGVADNEFEDLIEHGVVMSVFELNTNNQLLFTGSTDPNQRGAGDGWMLINDSFDRHGRDVLTGGPHPVRTSAAEPQSAVFVEAS